MSPEHPDPTPVSGELDSFGYHPPRLRVTATYDSEGTRRPTSLEVEVHDDQALPATLLLLVDGITTVLAKVGATTPPPVSTGTWTGNTGAAAARHNGEVAA
jgi:hypothetical protein